MLLRDGGKWDGMVLDGFHCAGQAFELGLLSRDFP